MPYLYEGNLRRFCKTHQGAIDQGLLNVHLWRHEHHTFHLKGLLVDEDYALLTGNNINPRAWRLDLENGLLIHDPHGQTGGSSTGPSWNGSWRTPGAWITTGRSKPSKTTRPRSSACSSGWRVRAWTGW